MTPSTAGFCVDYVLDRLTNDFNLIQSAIELKMIRLANQNSSKLIKKILISMNCSSP